MIVKKVWIERHGYQEWQREGWYLLGWVALYIRDCGPRERRKHEPFRLRVNLST